MKEGTEIESGKEIKIKKGLFVTLIDDRDKSEIKLGRIDFIATNNFFDTNLGYHVLISEG